MSEWITDRAPVKKDCNGFRKVWTIISSGRVCMIEREFVEVGDPWIPIIPPDPPKLMNESAKQKYIAMLSMYHPMTWVVFDGSRYVADSLPTREAAERIAAIYNEVNP